MRFFTCVVNTTGREITASARRAYESLPRSRKLAFEWLNLRQVAVLTAAARDHEELLVIREGGDVAVGMVRLDNRVDLERWTGSKGLRLSDLHLVLRAIRQHGTKYIPGMLGDFAFVVWNAAAQTGVAATDAFAVKRLYYTERNGLVAFASRAEALALDDKYEPQHLAELVALCDLTPELTVYSGVRALTAGRLAEFKNSRVTTREYWTPGTVELVSAWGKMEGEAAGRCRELLCESVRLRLSDSADTWAQLSGGLDSSSVVSTAQSLLERGVVSHGLAGTVTFVDRQGTAADERQYSEAVINRWGVRNEKIVDPPLWIEDHRIPPLLDQPRHTFAFHPRERHLCEIVQGAGGRVLLSGFGSDELFTGTMLFFADWVARGRFWPALREMAKRAAMGRASFWQLAYSDAFLPLLPGTLRHRLAGDAARLPGWLQHSAMRRFGLRSRAGRASAYAGRFGRKYRDVISTSMRAIGGMLDCGVIGDHLDVRHPFLYRPLVEFALQLPPELTTRPYARKWVLREAMRGILPEVVRSRVGKGASNEVLAWSLSAQRPLLEPLVQEPILAELGVVDAPQLRAAFDSAPQRRHSEGELHTSLQSTLMIEAWLQMRSGRWPQGSHPDVRTQ